MSTYAISVLIGGFGEFEFGEFGHNLTRHPCKLKTSVTESEFDVGVYVAIPVQLHSFLNWKLNAHTYVG